MIHGSDYLSKLYNDLITNTPQTFSMDISSEFGPGRIAQTKIKTWCYSFGLADALSIEYRYERTGAW